MLVNDAPKGRKIQGCQIRPQEIYVLSLFTVLLLNIVILKVNVGSKKLAVLPIYFVVLLRGQSLSGMNYLVPVHGNSLVIKAHQVYFTCCRQQKIQHSVKLPNSLEF